MENQILTDPVIKPDNNVLETALGKNFKLYADFLNKLSELHLVTEWNYYNDGKSWLCKLLNKKKNLAWLSVWNIGFKLTFYFTEKTITGIYELDIDNEIKTSARGGKTIGKLLPVIFPVKNKRALNDGLILLDYKKKLK